MIVKDKFIPSETAFFDLLVNKVLLFIKVISSFSEYGGLIFIKQNN